MRIKALSRDVKSMDGHRAYLELVDEYHAYKTNKEKERRYKMGKLTGIDNKILEFIKAYISQHGYAPTYEEIGNSHIKKLLDAGKIETDHPGAPRAIRLCDTNTETSWRKLISEAIDRVYDRMIVNTPPASEDERLHCEAVKEAIKGMFLKESRSELEAKFIVDNIAKHEEIFEICMNGNDLQFKKGLIELQRMQNEYILDNESSIL